MVHRAELLARLDDWLQPRNFQDYCPNGLQVEGRETVGTLVTGVTASLALIEAAIAANADMILVHHGYFWKGEDPCVRGMKKARLKRLLEHDLNLVAYHLPLDDHPDYGNNRQLAEVLGLRNARPLDGLVWQGELPEPMTPGALADHLASRLHRQPLHVGKGLPRSGMSGGAPAPPRASSTGLWPRDWMLTSVAKFPSPPPTPPEKRAFIIMPPAITPPSVMACRRWGKRWLGNSG